MGHETNRGSRLWPVLWVAVAVLCCARKLDGAEDGSADEIPAAPTNLIATTVSSSSISLSWLDNSDNEVGFVVQRSLSSTGGFVEVAALTVDTTTHLNEGQHSDTTYDFRVAAFNSIDTST
jgi:hypothetical protein